MYHLIINANVIDENVEKQLEDVKEVFDRAGKELGIHRTEYAGHARDIAAELTEGGRFAHLIAMGGDGTLHEVLNGIVDVEQCTLGLIPVGTGNDYAAAANIPLDAKYAAETIVFRAPCHIDYIELENGLRSINAVGAGIDVDVLKRVYSGKKSGKGKYLSAFIKSLWHYKCTKFKFSYDGGKEQEYTGLIVCLGNGKQVGGGIKLFPEARLNDGYMDLVAVKYLSRIKTLFAFIKLLCGKVNRIKEVTHVKCTEASFEPLDGNVEIQAEGEIYSGVPLKAKLIAGKLKFYLPEND